MINRLIISFLLLFTVSMSYSQDYMKMSSFVRTMAKQQEHNRRKVKKGSHSQRAMTALVRCTNTDVLSDNGCRIHAAFNNDIYIASIPLNRLSALAMCKEVKRIEANAPCVANMDTTRTLLQVDKASNYIIDNIQTKKSDVVIGIEDVGFDLTHPTFFNSDGTHNIKRFWDMVDSVHVDTTLIVGREFTTPDSILAKAHSTDNFIISHGTHTSGIAAGTGYNGSEYTRYNLFNTDRQEGRGVHDIVLVANAVSNDLPLIPDSLLELYTTALDLLGFKYIFDYADSVGKPCVINFSEGSHQDFYDNILYDEVLHQMIGPGRIIVAAAGNEGQKLSYLSRSSDKETARSLYYNSSNTALVTFRSPDEANIHIIFDALSETPTDYLVSTIGLENDSVYTDSLTINGGKYVVSFVKYPNCYDTLQVAGELYIEDLTHKTFGGNDQRVAFSINGNEELFYYLGQFISTNDFPSDAVKEHNVHFPGSSEAVICVGNISYLPGFYNYEGKWKSYYYTKNGQRSEHSSVGPNHRGTIKPDIMAPGIYVASSYSSYYIENKVSVEDIEHFDYNGRTYAWNRASGTSMSAPVVVAIITQWLEVCPSLTREQILEVFEHTASKAYMDVATEASFLPSTDKNNYYGYGEIDALAGLRYILEHFATDGIQEVAATPSGNSHSDISSSTVFDLTGRRLPSLSNLSRGLYIVGGKKVVRF